MADRVQGFNGMSHPSPKAAAARELAAEGGSCWISETLAGPAVTKVKQSTFTDNNLYWLNFGGGGTVYSLDFIVTFKPGSPLTTQWQHFSFPGGYAGSTSTPFGVPIWGGDPTLGPATLTVLADGACACTTKFEVVG
ncbi:MAG TPA: hypothetical protein VEU30_15765 [Thermoanaerobaculia bacterium]|nr:hypothetical protein [Thermoanaerobaculia bacterium]